MKYVTILAIITATAFAQGPLAPPGAPAPLMRTLSQIEARTPIGVPDAVTTATIDILQPGSYVLTGPVAVAAGTAISIKADFVTLDLNGFLISSTASPAAGSGVEIFGVRKHVTVKNGNIAGGVTYTNGSQITFSGPGFTHGVFVADSATKLVRVIDVSVSGVAGHGIYAGFNTSTAERCSVDTALTAGISAVTVSNSNASGIGGAAIEAHTASDCTGISLNGPGVSSRVATNCHGTGVAAPGVVATTVSNCVGVSETYRGISASNVANSNGYSNAGKGIVAETTLASTGRSTEDRGIDSKVTSGSFGTSTDSSGIVGDVAVGSSAASAHFIGMWTEVAGDSYATSGSMVNLSGGTYQVLSALDSDVSSNCYGRSTGNGPGINGTVTTGSQGTSPGLYGVNTRIALNARGQGGNVGVYGYATLNCFGSGISGIEGKISMNSYGEGGNAGWGLSLSSIASYCLGDAGFGMNALYSPLAIGCQHEGAANTITSPSKHLGTP